MTRAPDQGNSHASRRVNSMTQEIAEGRIECLICDLPITSPRLVTYAIAVNHRQTRARRAVICEACTDERSARDLCLAALQSLSDCLILETAVARGGTVHPGGHA
jgi:hypothetical protein